VPNVDISLHSGWFWATSTASFRERLLDFRPCWIVFIHVVRGRPGGLLQFSKAEAVKIFLASVSTGIHAVWLNREKRRDWTIAERCGCLVVHLSSSFCTWWFLTAFADTTDWQHQNEGTKYQGTNTSKSSIISTVATALVEIWGGGKTGDSYSIER